MECGKLIVIEGIDGAGKTDQCKILADRMYHENIPVKLTRECSDGPIGNLLRSTYLTGHRKTDERVINILYAADRLDHITNEDDGMLKWLNEGYNVINDRYYLSSLAYDTYAYVDDPHTYQMAMDVIWQRNKVNMALLTPRLTVYLDLDPEIAISRLDGRKDEKSIYETKEKIVKIKRSYDLAIERLIRDHGDIIIRVEADGTREVVHDRVWNVVAPVFGM